MKKIQPSLLRITIGTLILLFLAILTINRPIPVKQDLSISNPVSQINLEKHVKTLSVDYAPRNIYNLDNLNKTGLYITKELSKYSKNVEIQPFKVYNDNFYNVIAKFGNIESNNIIIVGAHYDGYSELPGADDNASGVAGILELARLLKDIETDKQIQIIAYSTEEPPYFGGAKMGSYIHANSIKNKNIELMISLEMIGYFSDEENSQTYPLDLLGYIYPTTGNFIAVVEKYQDNNAVFFKSFINKYTDLDAYSINAPMAMHGIDYSDHSNYWKHNYEAIMITDTSFFRNFNYHTKEDTYEKLNYEKMSKVVFGTYLALLEKLEVSKSYYINKINSFNEEAGSNLRFDISF